MILVTVLLILLVLSFIYVFGDTPDKLYVLMVLAAASPGIYFALRHAQ